MGTQVSPGIRISEIDKTLSLGQVALTEGGIAGFFKWGPVEVVTTVGSETELVTQFWKPDTNSASYFFTAANFLAYSNTLRVVRVVKVTEARAATAAPSTVQLTNTATFAVTTSTPVIVALTGTTGGLFAGMSLYLSNSVTNTTVTIATVTNTTSALLKTTSATAVSEANAYAYGVYVPNPDTYQANFSTGSGTVGAWAAKYVGALGNSLTVEVCASANAYKQTVASGTANVTVLSGNTSVVMSSDVSDFVGVGDILTANGEDRQVLTINSAGTGVTINAAFSTALTGEPFARRWKYSSLFTSAPGTSDYAMERGGSMDEMHVVVVDTGGQFSGGANTVLERYAFVSKGFDAKTDVGATNYYAEVINRKSPFVWWMGHQTGGTSWGSEVSSTTFGTPALIAATPLAGGTDGGLVADTDLMRGYDLFKDQQVEVSFILGASASPGLASYIIGSVVEPKMFAMGFFSPEYSDVVSNAGLETTAVIAYRDALPSSSFAVLDSGWKYQYDKYNDVYRYVPLNGDTAGCAVRADQVSEPWFSPAGFSRGQIKNVVKLPYNPTQANRDDLYRNGINPIVTFPGQGTVLYGDKTMQSKPSAFDRINVRRLFIALEKTIERSAKQQLFEQNDAFTRQAFVAMVEPYLRSVRGRRGITEYYVVCDETNNPPASVDAGEFRADIYVKPIRSINFIQLNFIAVRSDVSFTEVVTNLS